RVAQLEARWREVGPSLRTAAPRATLEDWHWAHAVYWSRGCAIPLEEGLVEGVVPGLDFANHSAKPNCCWVVVETDGDATVHLVPARGARVPRAEEELTIDYGARSDEEFLFHYGFLQDPVPGVEGRDVLMLALPLIPADEWDRPLAARVELLQRRGLAPRILLGGAPLSGESSAEPCSGAARASIFSDEARETIATFVALKEDVYRALKASEDAPCPSPAADDATSDAPAPPSLLPLAGMDLAVTSTLCSLLELKAQAQEDEATGTGSLEADEALLEAHARGRKALAPRALLALRYRAAQKRLCRAWLGAARAEQQRLMRGMARDKDGR
ncbi:hypothetical protein H632_c2681p0, partial [Helicosporidium sp. ATCC 50920]